VLDPQKGGFVNISDAERKQIRKEHKPTHHPGIYPDPACTAHGFEYPAWPCIVLKLLDILEHPDNASLLNAMDSGDRTRAQLITNQAVELGRLRNFIHAVYEEDCGLAIWDDPKYSEITEAAKAMKADVPRTIHRHPNPYDGKYPGTDRFQCCGRLPEECGPGALSTTDPEVVTCRGA
jgi:hypothetical protein